MSGKRTLSRAAVISESTVIVAASGLIFGGTSALAGTNGPLGNSTGSVLKFKSSTRTAQA